MACVKNQRFRLFFIFLFKMTKGGCSMLEQSCQRDSQCGLCKEGNMICALKDCSGIKKCVKSGSAPPLRCHYGR